MKSIALYASLAIVAVLAGTAVAQPQETSKQDYQVIPKLGVVNTAELKQTLKLIKPKPLPPLKLPDVEALSKLAWKADRKTLARQLQSSSNVVHFWTHKGSWILASRHEKCYEVPWQRSCTVARASLRLHTKLAAIAETRLTRELPMTNDWVTAVNIVQRIHPNTRSWLLSCSSGEGGHGGFVMNHQGSGASGWLQFMPGTFYGHAPEAFSYARSLGFILPDQLTIDIESPLAQAITGAYMRTHGMSSHWDPRIDPLCA